jgi:thioredoxin 1
MSLTLTDANFDTLITASGMPAVIDFWATWCPPCIAIGPAIDALATDFEGRVVVGKLNVDDNPEIAVRFGVTSLPCVVYLLDGKVAEKMVGAAAGFVYEKKLKAVLAKVG